MQKTLEDLVEPGRHIREDQPKEANSILTPKQYTGELDRSPHPPSITDLYTSKLHPHPYIQLLMAIKAFKKLSEVHLLVFLFSVP